MAEADYKKLRELININPMGCPPAPEIIEILKILFAEEEAKVALGLGFFPLPVKEIAYRTGVTPEVAEKHLESLADKGVVFAREKVGEWGYAHVNTFHYGKTTGFSRSPRRYNGIRYAAFAGTGKIGSFHRG